MADNSMKVYEAISRVTLALSREGISKERKNAQQGYMFRGIDDIYNALAPVLAENRLCVLPEVLERTCEERQTQKGGTLFYVTLRVAFDLVSAEDGSQHRIVTHGEAMDSGDKATNKAMAAAYKYAAMMTFCIPTEGDNDADSTTHEVSSSHPAAQTTSVRQWPSREEKAKAQQAQQEVLERKLKEVEAERAESVITVVPSVVVDSPLTETEEESLKRVLKRSFNMSGRMSSLKTLYGQCIEYLGSDEGSSLFYDALNKFNYTQPTEVVSYNNACAIITDLYYRLAPYVHNVQKKEEVNA